MCGRPTSRQRAAPDVVSDRPEHFAQALLLARSNCREYRQPLCHQGGESTSGRRGSQGSRLRTCGICSPTGFVAICAGAGQDRATPTSGDDRDTEIETFRSSGGNPSSIAGVDGFLRCDETRAPRPLDDESYALKPCPGSRTGAAAPRPSRLPPCWRSTTCCPRNPRSLRFDRRRNAWWAG